MPLGSVAAAPGYAEAAVNATPYGSYQLFNTVGDSNQRGTAVGYDYPAPVMASLASASYATVPESQGHYAYTETEDAVLPSQLELSRESQAAGGSVLHGESML